MHFGIRDSGLNKIADCDLPAYPGTASLFGPPFAELTLNAGITGNVVRAVGTSRRSDYQIAPIGLGIMVLVPFERQALFCFVKNPGHTLVIESTPAARGVSQAMQTISILKAGAVLIRLEVFKRKHLGIFALAVVGYFHFAGVSIASGYHSFGFKIKEITTRSKGIGLRYLSRHLHRNTFG